MAKSIDKPVLIRAGIFAFAIFFKTVFPGAAIIIDQAVPYVVDALQGIGLLGLVVTPSVLAPKRY